jgi:hypothetical protein
MLWSYGLMMRVRLMSVVVALVEPVATRGLVTVLRRHADALSADVAAWRRAVWERTPDRSHKPASAASAGVQEPVGVIGRAMSAGWPTSS